MQETSCPITKCGPYLDPDSNKLKNNCIYEVIWNVNIGMCDGIQVL